ncbi:beta family protein [Pseudolysobacter antarcticus]|uniref:beta family protein n=1 Tax=Pseudolysobacter antarcticus TaxID=2511995 RepID=UPI0013EBC799|nr:beta family protein [Pseudolysobacter antarcticus]
MALKEMSQIGYVPILDLRPAEMVALEELPEKDKGLMCPLFKLRPWLGSIELDNSVAKIKEVYGSRPCFLMLCDERVGETRRKVHDDLDRLRSSTNGFSAWCDFIEAQGNKQFIPSLQLSDPNQFDLQAERLVALSRGLVVVIELDLLPFLSTIVSRASRLTNQGTDVLFLLDFGRQEARFLQEKNLIIDSIKIISEIAPNAAISFSASSFPDLFTTIVSRHIFERQLFNQIRAEIYGRLIYSDRGSARAERQAGGGGIPAARIDYATGDDWFFFRDSASTPDRGRAYSEQAQHLIRSPYWDGRLHLWGTQMIERTAYGDPLAITSPNRSTAVRINIHLHQQLFYGDSSGLTDTEEPWID